MSGVLVIVGLIIVAAIVVGFLYFLAIYNGLIQLKNNIKKSWANIDVLLNQRHELRRQRHQRFCNCHRRRTFRYAGPSRARSRQTSTVTMNAASSA
mgnify:CR=1 FL=1